MSRMSKRKFELERGSVSKKIAYGSWKDGLKRSMQDPTLVLKSENLTVTIRDKFPKDLQSLTSDHIQLLEHMERDAFSIISRPFHLHVISKDFDSPCLKTKKHWNSFTTDFFRKSSDVLEELRSEGKIKIEKERFEVLLKNDLRCHWCKATQRNIPSLKCHIKSCTKSKLVVDKTK